MSLRTVARSPFGFDFALFQPNNDDGSNPTPARTVGGAGPFDFSDALVPAAVTLKWKIDHAAEASDTVDLSGVGDISAVTVDELVAAVTTAAPTGLTASKEAVTLLFKIAMTTPGATKFFQVYGEIAQYSMIGQGYTTKIVKSDTIKSFQETPTQKAEETVTTTDANGKDTEIITEGYRKGFTAAMVDTARDPELRALIEGGVYTAATKVYEVPTSETDKVTFCLYAYNRLYAQGSNKEPDMVGYVESFYRTIMGSVGQSQRQRGWTDGNYSLTGTSYTDEAGVQHGDMKETELTVSQYEALVLASV